MNIAAIYGKYDLWGKVRVKLINFDKGRVSFWLIRVDEMRYHFPVEQGLVGVMKAVLKDYAKCEPCEGNGVVPSEPYTASGNIPDCDTVRCKECGGSGERKVEELSNNKQKEAPNE